MRNPKETCKKGWVIPAHFVTLNAYVWHSNIFQICILKSKAIPCPRTGRFKCPVPKCTIDGRSRVGVAKHFRRDHKDYRSWRDVFIKKDAPDFILKPNEANDEIEDWNNLREIRFFKNLAKSEHFCWSVQFKLGEIHIRSGVWCRSANCWFMLRIDHWYVKVEEEGKYLRVNI